LSDSGATTDKGEIMNVILKVAVVTIVVVAVDAAIAALMIAVI
jgi:hypothetical protein